MAISRMGTTKEVKAWLKRLEVEAGCTVKADFKDALTAEATSQGMDVFKAIQKGKGGPWIIRFINGGAVSWPGR